MRAQGWFHDPYGIHDDRWFSDGRATRLVRDMGAESYDDPPSWEPVEPLTPVPPRPGNNTDLKRADAATRVDQAYDAKKAWIKMVDKILGQEPVYWMVSRSPKSTRRNPSPHPDRQQQTAVTTPAAGTQDRPTSAH
jgi:hypothetical protein